MSRLISLNITEDRLLEKIDAAFAKERSGPKPRLVRASTDSVRLNGRLYVAANDWRAADALFNFPDDKGDGDA